MQTVRRLLRDGLSPTILSYFHFTYIHFMTTSLLQLQFAAKKTRPNCETMSSNSTNVPDEEFDYTIIVYACLSGFVALPLVSLIENVFVLVPICFHRAFRVRREYIILAGNNCAKQCIFSNQMITFEIFSGLALADSITSVQ